jgi:hypothetical protein
VYSRLAPHFSPFLCNFVDVLKFTFNFSEAFVPSCYSNTTCCVPTDHRLVCKLERKQLLRFHAAIPRVTCLWHVATINVDFPDLTREFIRTIAEITHNRYNTISRLIAHKRESSNITVADSALVILGCSLLTYAPGSWSSADFTGRLLNHNWTISQLYLVRNSNETELKLNYHWRDIASGRTTRENTSSNCISIVTRGRLPSNACSIVAYLRSCCPATNL